MTKGMTPCEKLGYKVGDKFKFRGNGINHLQHTYGNDCVIVLAFDDDTDCPIFIIEDMFNIEANYSGNLKSTGIEAKHWTYEYLDELEKITDEVPAANESTHHISQVGDKVKVVKKCESQSNCHYGDKWDCFWVPAMDTEIGEVGEIVEIYDEAKDGVTGMCVEFGDIRWNFPSEALELIDTSISESTPSTMGLMKIASEEIDKLCDMADSWLDKAEQQAEYKESLIDKFYTFKEALGTQFDVALIITSKVTLTFDGYEFSGDEARIIDVMDKLVDLHG